MISTNSQAHSFAPEIAYHVNKLSQEQKNEVASWLNPPDGIAEKRKNFKQDDRKRSQPQKRKASNFGEGHCASGCVRHKSCALGSSNAE